MVNVTLQRSMQVCYGCNMRSEANKIACIVISHDERYTLPALCADCRRSVGIMLQEPDIGLRFQEATKE